MTTVSDISARDWSPKLGSYGEVVTGLKDIEQCLRIIWSTPVGSVPMRRDFGSTIHRWLDKPFDVAQANVPLAILEAARWEPRAIIRSVKVQPANVLHGMVVLVEWAVSENAPSQTLTLSQTDLSVTPEATRIITAAMAEAATGIDANVSITDYTQEFFTALND
jgi:phage baseplate assembly protein W